MLTDNQGNHYFTALDLYQIAQEALGKEPNVRDPLLLKSAAARPWLQAFGEEAYPTMLEKAAALMHSLAAHHLFFDGNKRTATLATTRFLLANGFQPKWDDETIYDFVLEVAQHQHDVAAIADWLMHHTVRMQDE
ncbi:MAG: type II toxin-antitoxin system death-on-curing family toxin [Phototrophicales bacterium]|nr:MAG: type II toxin-antitoxin system death-on-curing family toxin [Phototrophicales bacterium]